MRAESFLSCATLVTLWIVARQDFSVHGFLQVYWGGVAIPSSRDLSHPGIEPVFSCVSALAGVFFTTRATWEALKSCSAAKNK